MGVGWGEGGGRGTGPWLKIISCSQGMHIQQCMLRCSCSGAYSWSGSGKGKGASPRETFSIFLCWEGWANVIVSPRTCAPARLRLANKSCPTTNGELCLSAGCAASAGHKLAAESADSATMEPHTCITCGATPVLSSSFEAWRWNVSTDTPSFDCHRSLACGVSLNAWPIRQAHIDNRLGGTG